ncbi:alpha/beta fold hydrolase [Solwaraspora sp. WMMD406]|uniref:alpha/beta fold hydrolase n=1 Tax=Solwaraspora sp. WMMD406 TaxID=3016095 RepID=UPI0024171866|nr:alpha/beta fold hydrolase [Solwaraspora sp. WMMD406]MDG4762862.1 alpha/beta fold hydrolase [Solwaraspora sp. WMMD406]
MAGDTYRFGEYALDMARYQLCRADVPVHVEPRALDLLHYLIEHQDRVVPKNELLDEVWGDRFVSEAALTTALRSARLAIGDTGRQQRLIRTVHRRGYQFVGQATAARDDHRTPGSEPEPGGRPSAASPPAASPEVARPPAAGQPIGADRQVVRFCQAADGTRIAYATVGSGPPLLKAANWMTHLDLEWSTPVWSHWLSGLARDRQLIRYDERGCGMSDWEVPSFTFDDWVDDLETLADAIGLDRFPLLGVSQGGAVAVAYAVRHPERVSRLILAGAYARGRQVRARDQAERDEAALDLDLARIGWTHQDPSFLGVFAAQFLPEGTPEELEEFINFQRRTTSPANGVRFLEEFAKIDVSDIAHRVRCPTLILHSRDDLRVPTSQATELATLIPDSQLVLLDSRNHLLTASEPAWPEFLAQIDAFLTD